MLGKVERGTVFKTDLLVANLVEKLSKESGGRVEKGDNEELEPRLTAAADKVEEKELELLVMTLVAKLSEESGGEIEEDDDEELESAFPAVADEDQ